MRPCETSSIFSKEAKRLIVERNLITAADIHPRSPRSAQFSLSCCFWPVSTLQHTARGDDAIQEALYHLRDLTSYAHLLRFDMNTLYIPNVHIESMEMCRCKELIAQEILKTLLSTEIPDQDFYFDLRTALRLLQHNIRFLLQNSIRDHCLKDKVMVRIKNSRTDQQLMFIRGCTTFFQDWMYKCITSSDF